MVAATAVQQGEKAGMQELIGNPHDLLLRAPLKARPEGEVQPARYLRCRVAKCERIVSGGVSIGRDANGRASGEAHV